MLNIPLNTQIEINQIPSIADYFKQSYILINQNEEIIGEHKCNKSDPIIIYLRNDHYYLALIENYQKCKKCGNKFKLNNKKHTCNVKRLSFMNYKLKWNNMVIVKDITGDKEIEYDKVLHFDFETFQKYIKHEPYACGFWMNNQYNYFYGADCLDKFVDILEKCDNTILSAYNGSGFDYYFIVDRLTERGIKVNNLILSSGKLMSFEFGEKNKVFDLYLFISSSLSKACDSFNIINSKSEFDHKKITSWRDTAIQHKEVMQYLRLDVLALKELFEKFNHLMYESNKVNIINYTTASHMAYGIWSSTLEHQVEIPNKLAKYNFIRQPLMVVDVDQFKNSLFRIITIKL